MLELGSAPKKTEPMQQKVASDTQTPTLKNLIALLDETTLEVLYQRLMSVARAQEQSPEQMLLAFLDEGLSCHEEPPPPEGDLVFPIIDLLPNSKNR